MAACLNPFYHPELSRHLPCGKCFNCLNRRTSSWSFRLMNLERHCTSAYFVTLTYNDEFCPRVNNYATLYKPDVQNFMKRLRFAQNGRHQSPIKYYLCGEYGGKTYRPHYHLLLFNVDLKYLIGTRDAGMYFRKQVPLDGKFPYTCKSWSCPDTGSSFGALTVGVVNQATIYYTLKYMSKPKRIPLFWSDPRQPEFSLMSKGIGLQYLTDKVVKWHRSDLYRRTYLNAPGGFKQALPRYYRSRLYTDLEIDAINAKFILDLQDGPTTLSRQDMKRHSDIKLSSSQKNRYL